MFAPPFRPTAPPDVEPASGPRRRHRVVALTTAAALAVSAVLVASSGASASAATTGSFGSSGVITIPDSGPANPYPSTVEVSGMTGTIKSVSVELHDFSHTDLYDLQFLLVAPDGRNFQLLGPACGDASHAEVTISDDATRSMSCHDFVAVSGSYRPSQDFPEPLTAPAPAASSAKTFAQAFAGGQANGTWQLYVDDQASWDEGSIGSWSLGVQTGFPTHTQLIAPLRADEGQPVTLQANVTGDGTPTGSVQWKDGATVVGSAPLDAHGHAQTTVTDLAPGQHALTATYLGEGQYDTSTSDPIGYLTVRDSTTTTWEDAPVARYGGDVTFSAHVLSGAGDPVTDGQVTFTHDGQQDSAPVNQNGHASLYVDSTALGAGVHPVSVSYSGSDTAAPSDSDSSSFTILPDSTQTTLTATPGQTDAHDTVELDASVSSDLGAPVTGTVTFTSPGADAIAVPLTNGSATVTVPAGSTGTHTWTATYNATQNFTTSANSTDLSIYDSSTSAALDLPSGLVYGQPSGIVVTVTSNRGVPSGTVALRVAGEDVASAPVDAQGHADFSKVTLPYGNVGVEAIFTSQDGFAKSFDYQSTFVAAGTTSTSVSVDQPDVTVDDPVRAVARVDVLAPSTGTATGTVAFYVDGNYSGTGHLDHGAATLERPDLGPGKHEVTAVYGGDDNYRGSETDLPASVSVMKQATTTTMRAKPAHSVYGQEVDFDATVVGVDNLPVTTGDVTLLVDGQERSTAAVNRHTGSASFGLTELSAGTHTVRLEYAGTDDRFAASFDEVEVDVDRADPHVTFTSTSPGSALPGQGYPVAAQDDSGSPIELTAAPATVCTLTDSTVHFVGVGTCTVTADTAGNANFASGSNVQTIAVAKVPSTVTVTVAPTSVYGQAVNAVAAVPTGAHGGAVQFTVDGQDVGTPVALGNDHTATSRQLLDGEGKALGVGEHKVGATYTPADTATHAAVPALPVMVVVAKGATTTGVTVLPAALHATVTPTAPAAGNPSGRVTFTVDGKNVGSAKVDHGVAELAYRAASGAAHKVAAVYAGDANFAASSASTSRTDPSITATVAPAKPRSGWYRTPVTVSFRCVTHGSPLVGSCPEPVTLSHDGAAQSVTRTITSADGGVDTVTARGINIDRTAPTVAVRGVRNDATYRDQPPTPQCVGRDSGSGIASCTTSLHGTGTSVAYRVTAVDRAGNRRTASGSYRLARVSVTGTPYRHGAYTVHAGRGYQLVVIGGSRPRHIWAAPAPQRPTGTGTLFRRAGTVNGQPRWVLGFTVSKSMLSHPYWNLGIRRDKRTTVVTLHVVR